MFRDDFGCTRRPNSLSADHAILLLGLTCLTVNRTVQTHGRVDLAGHEAKLESLNQTGDWPSTTHAASVPRRNETGGLHYNVRVSEGPAEDILFEVPTPLGFRVRVTRTYWELIVTFKYPVMAGREADVMEALQRPSQIRQSRSDSSVFLFYTVERPGRWVCAVSK